MVYNAPDAPYTGVITQGRLVPDRVARSRTGSIWRMAWLRSSPAGGRSFWPASSSAAIARHPSERIVTSRAPRIMRAATLSSTSRSSGSKTRMPWSNPSRIACRSRLSDSASACGISPPLGSFLLSPEWPNCPARRAKKRLPTGQEAAGLFEVHQRSRRCG